MINITTYRLLLYNLILLQPEENIKDSKPSLILFLKFLKYTIKWYKSIIYIQKNKITTFTKAS